MARSRTGAFGSLEEAAHQDLMRVKAAVEASGDVAYEWDLTSGTITWSGGYAALPSFAGLAKMSSAAEFLRRIVPDDAVARRRALHDHLRRGAPFDCEYRLGDGSEDVWVHERGAAQVSADGRPLRLIGTLRVVTARKRREARLRYETEHDVLTGLFNRPRLCRALDDVMRFNRRYGRPGVYLTVGIDRLTIINNAFGHQAGDAVLLDLSQRLDMLPPIGDAVGRVGGDCFGIVVAEGAKDGIEAIAERILEQMRSMPVETPRGPVFVTASIGATGFDASDRAAQDVMARSEIALREAKRAGRDGSFTYSEADFLRQGHRRYAAVAEQVQSALKNDRLVFAYQPVIDAGGRGVSHYECLLRMVGEDGGLIAAGSFMPIIEEMGLVRQVDRHALDMAVNQLSENPDVCLAVNVSGLTASDRAWLGRLVELCGARPEIAERLIVEITETVALRDIEESARFVNAVRDLGCRVALDDFGAGYTSFRNLRALAVDVVKIDGSFVRDVARNEENQLFVRSLVGLARSFGLRTVAECVETGEDARALEEQGVDYLQGYHFGRPDVARPWRRRTGEMPPCDGTRRARLGLAGA